MKGPAESGQICSVGRRKIAKKIAKNKRGSQEKTLLDQGIHSSWPTVRETLKTHQACTIVLPTSDGSILRIRKAATPEHDVLDLYRSLGISHDVIKPQHTWTPSDSD